MLRVALRGMTIALRRVALVSNAAVLRLVRRRFLEALVLLG
jgi:hypothetical protein